MIEGYIPKADRKKILLLCDDIRMHSGVATMAREFVVNSAHHFNWYNLGAAIKHPDVGKVLDISADINTTRGIDDASVIIQPNNGYGDADTIRNILKLQKPDAIFIFTDPRYWTWLFEIEREIRSQIPIFWLNIWDEYPSPLYNKVYYNSVDLLMAISKQTKNINELVLGEEAKNKVIEYVPHGINDKMFFPIRQDSELYPTLQEFREKTIPVKDVEFVAFFNSRNVQRKHPADTILAFSMFCDMIGKEKASKCALVMHTAAVDQNGTDLRAVKEAFCDPEYVNVFFSQDKLSPQQMNLMYNMADVNILLSSNEGWGLSLTEAMMTGTMFIANVTGGMQDQMRFVDEKGEWINFSSDFPSNHRGTYKEHGEWALPVFPTNISLAGSVPTPYIFDDRCSPEDAALKLKEAYELGKEERDRRGITAREWVTSEEAQMTGETMTNNIIRCMEKGFDNFTPRPAFDLIKAEDREQKYIKHKLIGY
jgi:glycosyltransferase involved in cell wall biosynthesis